MNIDITQVHAIEQKVLALMTFFTTHMNELQTIKTQIQTLFEEISKLKADAQKG